MDYIVEVESEEVLKSLKPNFELLKSLKTRGVIVTAGVLMISMTLFPGFLHLQQGLMKTLLQDLHIAVLDRFGKKTGKKALKLFKLLKEVEF